jgi:hypothetical protein
MLGHLPLPAELVGEWQGNDEKVRLFDDGRFLWSGPHAPDVTGSWEIKGNVIKTIHQAGADAPSQEVVYWVIAFNGDTLSLRWLTPEHPTLPFTLRRQAQTP